MTCASPRRHSSVPHKYSSARPNASVENSTLSNGATSSDSRISCKEPRPFRIEIETEAVGHDGLEPDRPLGRLRECAGVGRSEAIRTDVSASELLGYRLQPDDLPGRLTGDLRHLLRGQQLTATVARVDEIPADAGCGQQAPVHLGRA